MEDSSNFEDPRVGQYKEIHIGFDEMGLPKTPLSKILLANSSQVAFVQDNHFDSRIRDYAIYPEAKALASLGFTHYLIEGSSAIQPILDKLKQNPSTNLYGIKELGSGAFKDNSFANAVYAMFGAGLTTVAIDHPDNWSDRGISKEERESYMTNHIKKVLQKGGKPLVLIGGNHAVNNIREGVSTAAYRLIHQGVSVVSVGFS